MIKTLYRFLFGTLRGRLIVGVAAVHAVMMALFIGDLTVRQRAMFLDRQIEEATALSQALATSAAGWIAADDVSGLQELVEAQNRYPEILFAVLTDERGRVLADIDKSRRGLYMLALPRTTRQTVFSKTPALVDVATPAMLGGRHVGWARVGIGQKAAGEKLAEITGTGVVYALAAILIGSVIAWLMGRQITGRLYAVQETIDAVRSGNRLTRSSLAGDDEPAVMAREFNAMLDALAERDVELRASEERFRSLIQRVQAAIVLHDSQGRILTSNPLASELLGFSADQLPGKAPIDPEWHFLREDGSVLPVAEHPVRLVLSSGRPLRGHVLGITRPDRDEVAWVLANAEPEYSDAGEISLVIVSFVDITERKRAEEALRQIEWLLTEKLASSPPPQPVYGDLTALNTCGIIKNSVEPGILRDIVGHYLSLLETSAAIYEKNGDYAFGIFASGWCQYLDAASRGLCATPDNRAALASGCWHCHESCWNKASRQSIETGQSVDVECGGGIRLHAEPIHANGEIIGSINFGYGTPPHDPATLAEIAERYHVNVEELRQRARRYQTRPSFIIDLAKQRLAASARLIGVLIERKRAEAEIRQLNVELDQRVRKRTAQLEAANQELEAFAYSVSHDLRAPLRHVDGFLGLLRQKIKGRLDEQGEHYMATIADAAKRMGTLIDDLLSFSRMARQTMSNMTFDLGVLVQEVLREFEPEAAGRNLHWQIADLPVITGDPAMLRLVLVNLVSNALKFTRPRQQAEIEIGCSPGEGTEVVVFVRDNGVGFDADYVDKLFGVFQRLHTADEFEGTGIGLANVRRIIGRLGGRVWAEGALDRGAAFYFSLPQPPRKQ